MANDAVKAAAKLLTIRTYSQHELEQKLFKQGYDAAAVGEAVAYLTKRGYLNDAALCDMLVERYAEDNKYSLREIYMRLKHRGLAGSLIAEKLAVWDSELEYQAAKKLAVKLLDKNGGVDRQKVVRRLATKGFKAATVSKVLDYLTDIAP